MFNHIDVAALLASFFNEIGSAGFVAFGSLVLTSLGIQFGLTQLFRVVNPEQKGGDI